MLVFPRSFLKPVPASIPRPTVDGVTKVGASKNFLS